MAIGDIDPRLKSRIKELLLKQVYEAPLAQLQVKMDAIIAANQAATGNPNDWLMYRNKPYRHSRVSPKAYPPGRLTRLHASLESQMAEYQAEEVEINTEMALANSAIVGVLNASNAPEDFKLLLPDSMHPPLTELERTGELLTGSAKRASPEELAEVRAKYDAGLTLLRRRMVLAMLG